jgi:FkbH-like protein
VVWDLDDTVWDGVLLEDGEVRPRQKVVEIVKELDARGILQSVASKNDEARAMEVLGQLGLGEYFLYPQINWNSKSSSVEQIARSLNIGLDAVAFIDDQPFEREEVNSRLPEVLCLDVTALDGLLDLPQMKPRFVTEDSRLRRKMYQSDIRRNRVEEEFVGPKEEFLAGLNMVCTIAPAREGDLQRAEELTVRTNQLNATGYTYSYDELDTFRQSDRYELLIAGLEDRFGSYGKIGLALVERRPAAWTIKLLLMSCRVMSRGVGSVMLCHLLNRARGAGVRLRAEFVPTGRNRMMLVTYKFAGFKEVERSGDLLMLEHDLARVQPFPDYLSVIVEG